MGLPSTRPPYEEDELARGMSVDEFERESSTSLVIHTLSPSRLPNRTAERALMLGTTLPLVYRSLHSSQKWSHVTEPSADFLTVPERNEARRPRSFSPRGEATSSGLVVHC
jgi:hypothetical protein